MVLYATPTDEKNVRGGSVTPYRSVVVSRCPRVHFGGKNIARASNTMICRCFQPQDRDHRIGERVPTYTSEGSEFGFDRWSREAAGACLVEAPNSWRAIAYDYIYIASWLRQHDTPVVQRSCLDMREKNERHNADQGGTSVTS